MKPRRDPGDDPVRWAPLGPPRWQPEASTTWVLDGLCVTDRWLPWTAEEKPTAQERRVMRGICADCPVRAECAAFAVENQVTWGFWAGRWVDEWSIYNWRWKSHRHGRGWAA